MANVFDQFDAPAGNPFDQFDQKSPEVPAPTTAGPMDLGDVASGAVTNFLPSAGRFVGDIAEAVTHPVETAKNIGSVGLGAVQKLIPGEQSSEQYADAVGRFFADRYGGVENLKKTMATDPVGFLADASAVLTGGAGALSRIPGMAGKVASVASAAGNLVDPLTAAGKAISATGKGIGKVASEALGVTTGAGATPIRTAYEAGREGGQAARSFTEHLRGNVPMEEVLADAKAGLDAVKADRQAAYKAGMTPVEADQTILDLAAVDRALAPVRNVGSFTGKKSGISIPLAPSTAKTVNEIDQVMRVWRALPPDEFHTAAGFDALKKRLGDVVDGTEIGSPARNVATQAYNIVKSQIVKQAPEYAKVMKGYQEASDLIKEIEKTLSMGKTASADTKLRKLQSVMRNNVNTNYGQREALVRLLQAHGATNIMQKLAGHALSTIAPRGLAKYVLSGNLGMGALSGLILNPASWAPLISYAMSSSPRLVGEAALGAGKAAKALSEAGKKVPGTAGPRRALYPLLGSDIAERARGLIGGPVPAMADEDERDRKP